MSAQTPPSTNFTPDSAGPDRSESPGSAARLPGDTVPDCHLTAEEQAWLTGYEQDIRRGLTAFNEIAAVIFRIDSEELYRPHRSLARYCALKWNYSMSDTSRYKRAGEVLAELAGTKTCPTTESQCRELAKLTPGTRRRVWEKLLEDSKDGKVTAAKIADAVQYQVQSNPSTHKVSTHRMLSRLAKTSESLFERNVTPDVERVLKEIVARIDTALQRPK
ncbi:MAG: hypothetical protein JWM11_5056 [Planctomycetaceae bacterium]|nr:hypothetical protein [Planctomycetaceae bacterium]